MKKKYKQLTKQERDRLCVYLSKGLKQNQIARKLDRDKGTISRELNRNSSPKYRAYLPHKAQERASLRKQVAASRPRLKNERLRSTVLKCLRKGLTPEQISGFQHKKAEKYHISYEAIYQFIYTAPIKVRKKLIKLLVRSHRKRFKRTHSHRHKKLHIPQRVSIKERPKHIDLRKEPGHWEADTMGRTSDRTRLVILCERTSRRILLNRMRGKSARSFSTTVIRSLSRFPKHMVKSITYDNGVENTEHVRINKHLSTKSYFCEPYHSWEKGSVENSAGLVRRIFPKGTNFGKIPKRAVKRAEYFINRKPRKIHGFDTNLSIFKSSVALAR